MPVLAEEIAKARVVAESLFATMRKQYQKGSNEKLGHVIAREDAVNFICSVMRDLQQVWKRSSSGGMSDGSSFIPADPSVRASLDDARFIYVCMFSNTCLIMHVYVS